MRFPCSAGFVHLFFTLCCNGKKDVTSVRQYEGGNTGVQRSARPNADADRLRQQICAY
jgi:hypothetical protein